VNQCYPRTATMDIITDEDIWAPAPLLPPKTRADEAHDCEEWSEYLGGSYSVEPHGEAFWDEGNRCTVCGYRWAL
jgi:hypothetical protein